MWNAKTNAKQLIFCAFSIRKRVKDLFYFMQASKQNLTFISFQMTNISIPNIVAMEQIYKCYNVPETQFEFSVFTHSWHNETHHADIAMNST